MQCLYPASHRVQAKHTLKSGNRAAISLAATMHCICRGESIKHAQLG